MRVKGGHTGSPGIVRSAVTDPRLVAERRDQIIGAATKLFSERGYYPTTMQDVAREVGISVGLIYQYFRDKDDVLFLTLEHVLKTYEREIPAALEGVVHPLERLCVALGAYCGVIDRLRDATVLTYRSTKSLRPERRAFIKEGEARTNRLLEDCVRTCIAGGFMRPVNDFLLVYQFVLFAHAWALKSWALRERYALSEYVEAGIELLIEPFLTDKGRAAMARIRRKRRQGGWRRRTGPPV